MLDVVFANSSPFVLIAGPCQMESREHTLVSYKFLAELTTKLNIPFVFKISFDKANRTTHTSKRGMGFLKSLEVFEELHKMKAVVLTDVHDPSQVSLIAKYVDIIQIPAFLCRQTDLLIAAGETGKVVNVKKGQFLAPTDMKNVVEKVRSTGNRNVLLTERGTTFGYGDLVVDMRSLNIMKAFGPVIFDATHSVQRPGGLGTATGGNREFVEPLAKAAVAIGVAGIFIECHEDPDNAPSDGPNMIPFRDMEQLLTKLKNIDTLVKGNNGPNQS